MVTQYLTIRQNIALNAICLLHQCWTIANGPLDTPVAIDAGEMNLIVPQIYD